MILFLFYLLKTLTPVNAIHLAPLIIFWKASGVLALSLKASV